LELIVESRIEQTKAVRLPTATKLIFYVPVVLNDRFIKLGQKARFS